MLNKIRKLQNKKGFTLVELIVVIAIIAILTAVIVPLVGRYSAQATYTTLQDGAKTVSTAVASALSDATMSGALANIDHVWGVKTSNTSITVTIRLDNAAHTTYNVTSTTSSEGTPSGGSDVQKKVLLKAAEQLLTAIPEGASFKCTIYKNAVSGTVYSTDSGNDMTAEAAPGTITEDTDFSEAYRNGTGAIGVQGSYLPTGSTPSTTTAAAGG